MTAITATPSQSHHGSKRGRAAATHLNIKVRMAPPSNLAHCLIVVRRETTSSYTKLNTVKAQVSQLNGSELIALGANYRTTPAELHQARIPKCIKLASGSQKG